jgi:hypothetical protein
VVLPGQSQNDVRVGFLSRLFQEFAASVKGFIMIMECKLAIKGAFSNFCRAAKGTYSYISIGGR